MVLFALVPVNSSMALDITLAWDSSSSDVDGYKTYYREAGHSYDYSLPAWEGWETTCTIYGLNDETTYYFVVRAYNELGESGNSNEASSAGPGTGPDIGPSTGIGTGLGTGAEAGGCFIASACKG
jgi:hypothetical protein